MLSPPLAVLLLFFIVSRVSTRKPPPSFPHPRNREPSRSRPSPPGAAVSGEWEAGGTATGGLQIQPASGSVDIEARLPGYQTAKKTMNLAGGDTTYRCAAARPLLALKLLLPADGRVAINDEAPVIVQDGQFSSGICRLEPTPSKSTPGEMAPSLFHSRSGGRAGHDYRTSQRAASLRSANQQLWRPRRVSTRARRSWTSRFDGQPLGQVDKNGLDLPKADPREPRTGAWGRQGFAETLHRDWPGANA